MARRGKASGKATGKAKGALRPKAAPPAERFSTPRLLRNLALAALPVVLLWLALTPFYNRFLIAAGGNLVRLTEVPNATELVPALEDRHYALVVRTDFPPATRRVGSFRVTDLHFHLLLLGTLFLAVPGVPWQERLRNLGWALLAAVCFHVVLVLLWVKFQYATQLGDWSLEHYGPAARNFWGLAKHLADLPVKLGLPLGLWVVFYLDRLLPGREV